MERDIDLKDLERRAFRSNFQDGVWDMYLGLLLLQMAVGVFLADRGIGETMILAAQLGFAVLVMGAFIATKKWVSAPRLGRVRFGKARKRRLGFVNGLLTLAALLGLAAFFLGASGKPLSAAIAGIPIPAYLWAGMCLMGFSVGASLLDYPRLVAYGVLYAFAFPGGIFLERVTGSRSSLALSFLVPAGIMVIIGGALFLRFLRDHPAPSTGAGEGQNRGVGEGDE